MQKYAVYWPEGGAASQGSKWHFACAWGSVLKK
jgi:hypothetical protein